MKRALGFLLLLAAPVPAQDAPSLPSHPFLNGWITELLHGDLDAATKIYKEAWKEKQLPNFQSELAGLRLWESTFVLTQRLAYSQQLRDRAIYGGGIRGTAVRTLEQLTPKFDAALKARDRQALAALRQEVRKFVQSSGSSVPSIRNTVWRSLPSFRGEATATVDATLEALKRERQRALNAKDHAKAYEIWKKMQLRSLARRREASRRLGGKRRIEMTRLHLAGQHERAQGMERVLRGQRNLTSLDSIRSRIAVWKREGKLREQFKVVQENLENWLSRPTLMAEERTILTELQARLAELAMAEKHEEAFQLAAQVPYRNILYRTPRNR